MPSRQGQGTSGPVARGLAAKVGRDPSDSRPCANVRMNYPVHQRLSPAFGFFEDGNSGWTSELRRLVPGIDTGAFRPKLSDEEHEFPADWLNNFALLSLIRKKYSTTLS
jgi:hypothetical protein